MKTLVTPADNSKALSIFRKKLENIAYKQEELEWKFPNGSQGKYLTYLVKTYLDELQIGVPEPERWGARNLHLIRFAQRQGSLSPDVEINIPVKHNRRVSGLYAKDANGEIWLCSRGLFTAFRGKIKRDISFSYFDKWLYEIDDEGKLLQIIPVCSLSSPTISSDIANFTTAVQELKKIYKDESYKIISPKKINKDSPKLAWRDINEFEGTKSSGDKVNAEYQSMHGPLCNQLKISLEKSLEKNKNFIVRKNKHIDAAIVAKKTEIAHSIFEVKTASLPSSQIYTAVGQILYYKTLYGDPNTHLYLVLPSNCKSFDTEKFIEELGMQVIYGESGKFKLPNGEEYIVSVS